jgi:hypothetical protein
MGKHDEPENIDCVTKYVQKEIFRQRTILVVRLPQAAG